MKVFSIFGFTGSGKTTTIEKVIKELRNRRYSVGSVKEIHYEKFSIDMEGTNTYRHREAGASLVTARGHNETDILYQEKLDIKDILKHYTHYDYVVLEGVTDCNCPKILTARNEDDVVERMDDSVFAISGVLASTDYQNELPVIDGVSDTDGLVDLIEEKVFDLLPDFDPKCCDLCGKSCRELCSDILREEAYRNDCLVDGDNGISLSINGQEIQMVPFVKRILSNAVLGVVTELDGYKNGDNIEIKIRGSVDV